MVFRCLGKKSNCVGVAPLADCRFDRDRDQGNKNGLKRRFLIKANWSASTLRRLPSLDLDFRTSLRSSIALDSE